MPQLPIQQAFDLALQHHHAGRLKPAEELYRQILAHQPQHTDALHLLGVIAAQVGQSRQAVDLIRQALAFKPDFPEALSSLGNALKDCGQLDEAIAAYRQALALNPDFPDAYSNLGNALHDRGQLPQAIAAYRQALALNPNFPAAHSNLGNALPHQGHLDQAIAACRQALALNPNYPEAYNNLGHALSDNGQLDQALVALHQALALKPDFPEAFYNLANALLHAGRLDEAIAAYRQALVLRPNYAEALGNLGLALKDKGQLNQALAALRQAIALKPLYPEAHYNLGLTLRDMGQLDAAIAAYRHALAANPKMVTALNNLGTALSEQGLLDQALADYRQALALQPDFAEAHSNLILALHYHPDSDALTLAEEHRRWNRRHAEPLQKFIAHHPHDRSPNRRLKIGYVSPDLRRHATAFFLLPLIESHDHQQFHITCFTTSPKTDDVTERLRRGSNQWCSLVGLSDAQAANLIRNHQIDILVDLALHTADNRLRIFARKPAPVQVSYLAYCSSTGLPAIDYRLSDPYLDPPAADESLYSEQTIRLPETYWCYQPHAASPTVSPLPALAQHHITFGCLNSFCKISPPTLAAWAKLLQATPNSQLLLHAHPGTHRQALQDQLAHRGIQPQRIRFAGRMPLLDYLRLYHEIDIALDTFPYGGGTTTCDALWMGVPVVSLIGKTAVGRGGLSILSNLGLPELVADSQDQYIHIAATLAHDLPRLAHLRATLRERLQASPLMDAPRFARHIESAYRQMWHTWCPQPPALR